MLKMPKKPRLPKKRKATASVSVKQNYLRRVAALQQTYDRKERETKAKNKRRESVNRESERLSRVIANIHDIGSSTRSCSVRRKPSKKKAAPKKKTAKKKTARSRKR